MNVIDRIDRMFTPKSNPELHEVMAEIALAKPPLKSLTPSKGPTDPKGDAYLAEYAELAGAIGIMPPDLAIESFKAFMVAHDLPIYSLQEVIAYMDDKAAKESKHKSGWEWRPLRAKDHLPGATFGTAAERKRDQYGRTDEASVIVPASDYYRGPSEQSWHDQSGVMRTSHIAASSTPYDKTIPLHALRRVALIEKEHTGPVSFLVCDYALAPAIQHPDPFLLAVVPNLHLHNGTGRFVIDFWDEPGFGIDKMLK